MIFNKLKHAVIGTAGSVVLKKHISSNLKGVGEILELKLDPEKQSVDLLVDLDGEQEPINIKIKKYNLNGKSISIENIEIDKPWMNTLAQEYGKGLEFEVPSYILKVLK